MSYTYTESIVLEHTSCVQCGMAFAVPQSWLQKHRDDGGGFFCPNGHSLIFTVTNVEKLRRELEEKSRALTASKCETLRERQERDKAERKLKRVKNGVCPCCNRSFQNLARHMKTKHPEAKGKP